MVKIRLHQFLSRTGAFKSKKDLIRAIHDGEICLEDRTITDQDYQVSKNDNITYKGKPLQIETEKIYLIMNKPAGVLSSKLSGDDIRLRKKSAFSLLKDLDERTKNRLFVAGRLDEDSTGLLILTTDGKLAHRISNPESRIEKQYYAIIARQLNDSERKSLERGIDITLEENGVKTTYHTKPSKIKVLGDKKILISIIEGKKREIKRMLQAVNNKILYLCRVKIGNIDLNRLRIQEGKYIKVTKDFILEHTGN